MRFFKIIVLLCITYTLATSFDVGIISNAEAKIGKHRLNGRKGKKIGVDNVWERITHGLRIPIFGPSPYGTQQLVALPSRISTAPPTISTVKKTGGSAANDKSTRISSVIIPKKSRNDADAASGVSRLRALGGKKKEIESNTNLDDSNHYTALGRLKLAPREVKNSKLKQLYKDSGSDILVDSETIKNAELFKSGTIRRMRNRLGMHPELFNNTKSNGGLEADATSQSFSKSDTKKGNVNAIQQLIFNGCSDFNKSSVIAQVKQGLLSQQYMQLAEECRLRQNTAYARISRHIGGYGREYLQQVGERARPFLYHIAETLSKHGLPMDLALLPIVESAYQPTALSSASAAGIWQFIPSTGKEFGLTQTEDYDARLDVTAETQAAVRFLSALRDHYGGDWWLALAAYNAGPGAVDAAISRNVEAGLGRDFWSLELPQETMDYVPRLLALSSIFRNLGPNGLKLRSLKNEPYFVKVSVDRPVDLNRLANKNLSSVAQLASYDSDEFSFLNTAYLKQTLPQGKPLSFLLPIKNANLLHQSLAFLAQADKSEKPVELPTTVFAQAGHAKTDIPLLSVNLDDESKLMAFNIKPINFGEIKTASTDKSKKETSAKAVQKEDWVVHYLDQGESLATVAEHHGIDEEILREANKLKRKQIISLGQRLLVPLRFLTFEPVKKRHPSILFNGLSDNSGVLLMNNVHS